MFAGILAFLGALVPYVPALISIAGFLLNLFGQSKANLDAYQAFLQANKDAGLITVENMTKLSNWHTEMAKDYADKQAAHQQIAAVLTPPPKAQP